MDIYYLYPLFLCTLPINILYAQNCSEISKQDYFQILSIFINIIIFGCLGLFLIFHNLTLSLAIFSLIYYMIMYGNYIKIATLSKYKRSRKRYNNMFFLLYLITFISICSFIFMTNKYLNINFINAVLFYISVFLSFFVVLDIIQKDIYKVQMLQKFKDENTIEIKEDNKNEVAPDIYHIILDDHAGFNNPEYFDESFKIALEKRGFKIFTEHQSNHNVTELSVASTLNMEYFVDKTLANNFYFHSKLLIHLLRNNYKCNILYSKWISHVQRFYNPNVKYYPTYKLKYNKFIKLIVFFSLINHKFLFNSKTETRQEGEDITSSSEIENNFTIYKNLPIESNPQYNFMHLMAPHGPYLFDEFGLAVNSDQVYNEVNYFGYLKYINNKIIDVIDNIQNKMKPNSLIILHSDHGHPDNSVKRYSILSTIYFPDKNDTCYIPEKLTLINLYRLICNKYFNTNYELLDDLFYKYNYIDYSISKISSPLASN